MRYVVFPLVIISLLLVTSVNAQPATDRLNMTVYYGFSTYDMGNLKKINKLTADLLPFQINQIDDFDPGFYFGTSVQTRIFSRFFLGVNYQYYSTGSRIGQKDYSGYYSFDQIITGHLFSLEPGFTILKRGYLEFSSSLQIGMIFSDMEIIEKLVVQDFNDSFSQDFCATSFVLLPSVKITVPILHFGSIFVSTGGLFDLMGGRMHQPGSRGDVLYIGNSQATTGWGGFRASAGISVRLIR